MADLIYVSIFVAFTALCIAYISWCDRIIGSDEPDTGGTAVEVGATKDPVSL
ncbi:MAG: hypothetical protein Q7V57_09235 [Actinomycetota bacterium]|nr:hypothetical protein [Actinomycetota bacterium]